MLGFSYFETDNSARPGASLPPVALTVAGHDPGSGAGITADLAVFASLGLYGTSVITALTVQSTLGVAEVRPVSGQLVRQALNHLHADLPAQGVKIGMVGSGEVASAIADFLVSRVSGANAKQQIPIVLDPVLRSSSGAALLTPDGVEIMLQRLLPVVGWVTPNWSELAVLTGLPVASMAQAEAAANVLGDRYPHLYVVVTGGDQQAPTDLLRMPGGELHRFTGEPIETTSNHGTGCVFSSTLLSGILLGSNPILAVQQAKDYVTEALRRSPGIGHGRGPLETMWPLTRHRRPGSSEP